MRQVYSTGVRPAGNVEVWMREVLMVIAPSWFRDEEYEQPRAVFEARGAHVTTASTEAGPATGRYGSQVLAEVSLCTADLSRFAALVFVGGSGAEVFFDDPDAHGAARKALDLGQVVGAICVAPSILARAGLLAGKRATAFPDCQADLEQHGAIWTGRSVEIDGLIVTASGPEASLEFGETIADIIGI
jgi:protease I